ncbi:MAG: HlyD family efflux transporter periplasmic adaptor subunit [Marinilabiliaceae bacterium]|jgi:HlyD family secretion protein|nr:HlyD family efflux transporter periplasmic adaptor subunit [Marinilabiliaceae bacterium]
MKNPILFLLAAYFLLHSCSNKESEADAWGSFEAEDVLVSAQYGGQIISLAVNEGELIGKNSIVAVIDTLALNLKLQELYATKNSARSKLATIASQNDIYKQQISNLSIDQKRVSRMLGDGAATQKQLDDIVGAIAVLEKQLIAGNSQNSTVISELAVIDTKIDQVRDQINRSVVRAPIRGTLISKYAEEGEITAPGKPLVKLANIEIIKLRVYVSGDQLAGIATGSQCKVRIDKEDGEYYEYSGTIVTVGDKAEFTPKIIQTKKERVSMVYPVKIEVKNDGKIKIGMPGEAIFN